MLSYYFCEKYGDQQSAYLDANNCNVTRKTSRDITRLINTLSKSISLPSHYRYITHHATVYQNVPLWVVTNALTFGQISKMYQYATTDIRAKVSLNFAGMTEVQLPQKKGQYIIGKKDLFAVVIALRYLIPNEEFKVFRKNLSLLIKTVTFLS